MSVESIVVLGAFIDQSVPVVVGVFSILSLLAFFIIPIGFVLPHVSTNVDVLRRTGIVGDCNRVLGASQTVLFCDFIALFVVEHEEVVVVPIAGVLVDASELEIFIVGLEVHEEDAVILLFGIAQFLVDEFSQLICPK